MIERKFNKSVPHDNLRLHSSERNTTWGKLFTEYKKSLTEEDIKFYPNTDELNPFVSNFYENDNFLMGFGSDRCIKYFFEVNTNPHWFRGKRNLVISNPTFPMYGIYGQMFGTKIKTVDYNIIKFPIDKFIKTINSNSIVVISNPSSPIGDIIQRDDIIRILEKGVPTLIDEAYIEFSNQTSCLDLISTYSNLYVTRTLSKAYGSAGVRFGTIFSQPENIKKMNQYRDMYEISGPTLKWVKLLCTNKELSDKYIQDVKDVRGRLLISLYEKGIKFIPSESNWFHIRESNLPQLPKNIEFRKNCVIPHCGDNWIRLQITDNIKDYQWILK